MFYESAKVQKITERNIFSLLMEACSIETGKGF